MQNLAHQALIKDNYKYNVIMFMLFRVFLLLLLLSNFAFADKPYVSNTLLQKIVKKYKYFAKRRFIYQQKILDSLKGKSEFEKLDGVNRFYNEVRYESDMKLYHKIDYWATPWQFLGKDRGDCEDYVIAKYFALLYLGVNPKKLFFTYVRSSRFKAAHMVLTYFKTPRSEPLVLDSINQKIFPASKRTDLTPIYNFNGQALYRASKRGAGKKVNNNIPHNKWNELLLDMKRKII